MNVPELAVALVAAHIFADFGLQRAALVDWKSSSVLGVLAHVAIYGVVTWMVLPVWSAPLLYIVIGLVVAHAIIDLWKARGWPPYARLSPLGRLALDQAAHLATLVAALAVAADVVRESATWLEPWAAIGGSLHRVEGSETLACGLVIAAAYVLAIPGGSVMVRALLSPYARALPSEAELSLGRVIGYLERLILLTLLLVGQYAAMAVIVAAKSLIRIPSIAGPASPRTGPADAAGPAGDGMERITTEYFLIGTLASIAIALFTGVIARAVLSIL